MIRYPQTTASATPLIADALRAGVEFSMLQQADELNRFLNWTNDVLPGRPAVVVEIGSHQGGSAAAFATFATDLMLSIDLPDGVGGGRTLAQLQDRDRRLAARWPIYQAIHGDSHLLATHAMTYNVLSDRRVDLLFIDGDHSYDGVADDFENFRATVRPGGIIALHDIVDTEKARSQGFEVARFWEDVRKRYPTSIEFLAPDSHNPDWGGIGAVVVG